MIKQNLVALFEQTIQSNWDLPAFSDYKGEVYNYRQVAETIFEIHAMFKRLNIEPGDRVALLSENSSTWAMTYLATLSYGAVIVPILPDFHTRDIAHILQHSESSCLFTIENFYDKLDSEEINNLKAVISLKDFSLFYLDKKISKKWETSSEISKNETLSRNSFKLPQVENPALASISYTSGTTGFSKGVMTSHNNLVSNIVFAIENLVLHPGDKILSFLPLAHSFGCAFEFLFPFCRGAFINFLNKIPSPRIIMEAFEYVKPRLILSVPLILEKIYNKEIKPKIESQPVKSLLKLPGSKQLIQKKIYKSLVNVFGGNFQELIIGGAPLNHQVEEFLMDIKFPMTIGYGMTECAPLISYSSWKTRRIKSVGKKVDNMEVTIDSDDPQHKIGEILVKGENLFMGYFKDEETTRKSFKGEWFCTGDLGTMDDDGFIYINGRSKTMILGPSGQNIFPDEIESRINNLPLVQESLVLERNQKLVALVYPDFVEVDKQKINQAELKNIMEENRKILNGLLPQYAKVTEFQLYPEEFEKSPTKKIKRYLYR
ncbi:MAG: AMP-binding protein [Candidatus Marinimicrobia bacterium]|nr:AMP-binding protein [Candidatus Neomarinimicrobiota bacterium]